MKEILYEIFNDITTHSKDSNFWMKHLKSSALCLMLVLFILFVFVMGAVADIIYADPALPKAVPNNGTGEVTVTWDYPYESYTVSDYNLVITLDGQTVESKNYLVNDKRKGENSPLKDRYVWIVPKDAKVGRYQAELQIMTEEAGKVHMGIYVKFDVSEVGTLVVSKYVDRNGNGKRDLGEGGLAGCKFKIITPTNENYTFTTDADGINTISGIATGTYKIIEIEQPGYRITEHSDSVYVGKDAVANAVFGNQPILPVLTVIAFEDRNQNGKLDAGEPPLPGWQFSAVGPVSFSNTSDSKGKVSTELEPGTYTVTMHMEPKWIAKTPIEQRVELNLGDRKELYFGSYRPPPGDLNIVMFEDKNRNGIKDAGEAGIPGWEFRLDGPESFKDATNSTGGIFWQPNEGTYTITASPRPGWIFTTASEKRAVLKSGSSQTIYFGCIGPQNIICYHDKNVNGRLDEGEPKLAGWSFDIKDANGHLIATRSTDDEGLIGINDLPSGSCMVTERLSSDLWYNTTPISMVVEAPGPDVAFGNDMYRTLRVFKFNDVNRNKLFDENESALSGWEFQVDGQVAVTDSSGIAEFKVRANREYLVSESLVSSQVRDGWQNTTELNMKVLIEPDDKLKYIRFGNYKKPIITETSEPKLRIIAFNDSNSDGSRGSNEEMLSNIGFRITNIDRRFASTDSVSTDANGTAQYLCPSEGNYTVELQLPANWCSTKPIIVTESLRKGDSKTLEFGLNACIPSNCSYRYPPEKTNMTFRLEDENLIVRKSIDPWVLTPEDHNMANGGRINYTITVSSKPRIGQADLVLAVDTSGSIIESDYSALARIDEGITSFVELMQRSARSGLRIGLISWDSDIDESVLPTDKYTDVINASHRLRANSQELTMYHVGMNGSIAALEADPRNDAKKVMVFITDARNEYEPFENLPDPDVSIYVLLIGGVQMNDTYQMLWDLADSYNGRLFRVDSSQDIVSALNSIGSESLLAQGSIKDIEIKDTLPSYLRPMDSGSPKGNVTNNMDGINWNTTTLSWRVPALNNGDSWSATFPTVFCWKLQSNVVLSEKGRSDTSMVSYADPDSGDKRSIRLPEVTIWLENTRSKPVEVPKKSTPGLGSLLTLLVIGTAGYLIRRVRVR